MITDSLNKAAVLETSYFKRRIVNVYKSDVVMCLYKTLRQFWSVRFKVCTCKISDKTDKFLLNYNNIFWGLLFIRTQCVHTNIQNTDGLSDTQIMKYYPPNKTKTKSSRLHFHLYLATHHNARVGTDARMPRGRCKTYTCSWWSSVSPSFQI